MIWEIIEFTAAMVKVTATCKDMIAAIPKKVRIEHLDPRNYRMHKMKPPAGFVRRHYWLRIRSNPIRRKCH